MAAKLNQSIAREFWNYNPKTGIMTWRQVRSPRIKVGQEAGWVLRSRGGKRYRQIKFKGFGSLLAHRLIWLWVTGYFPSSIEEIDHIDGNGMNNEWVNLRLVTHAEQGKNQRLRATNKTGATGVNFNKRRGKYHARIGVGGERYHLGYFTHFKDAVAVRKAASKKHGYHSNHGQVRPL